MHIAVTGASGLVGREIVSRLISREDRVTRLVRHPPGDGEAQWDPLSGRVDMQRIEGIDAVIHLAGENIASRRWTSAFKERVRQSRVRGTASLARAIAGMGRPPRVFLSASAVGFYGNRGDEPLDETSPPGTGFLAETCQQWEREAESASSEAVRVVLLRFGMILSAQGGALPKMLLPFRWGIGGNVGSGKQVWSWIGLPDAVRAILHCLDTDSLRGPVNLVSPHSVTNAEFTRTLAGLLKRPALLPVPPLMARLALGEMANELLLASAAVRPQRLLETGFVFDSATLMAAFRDVLRC